MVNQDTTVAIVVPVLNEEKTILSLLESFEALSLFPKEVILVDGGSIDRTVEVITRYLDGKKLPYEVQVMILPYALPGRGRNEGVRKTDCPLVACTDAGGHVDPDWLKELMAPFQVDPGCEMVIGNCRPDASNFFERCTFYVTIESPRRKSFIFLGGASIAFKKSLWEKVRGYPEGLYPCEDKAFLQTVKRRGAAAVLSDRAVVYWKSRPALWPFFRQYFLYGRGDAQGGFVRSRYFLRALFYGTVLFFLVQRRFEAGALLCGAYLGWVTLKGVIRLKDPRAILILPLLFLVKDIAQLLGFAAGHFRRADAAR